MRAFILLFLCCVCKIYGDNATVTTETTLRIITVTFDIRVASTQAHCFPKTEKNQTPEDITQIRVKTGAQVRLQADLQTPYSPLEEAKCVFNNGSGPQELGTKYVRKLKPQQGDRSWFENLTVTKQMFGNWSCNLSFNYNTQRDVNPVDNRGYSYVVCNLQVNSDDYVAQSTTTTTHPTTAIVTPSPDVVEKHSTMDYKIWAIVGGVGSLVLLIIIGQTIALCYFRRKAQPRRRMDKLASRSRSDRNDRARYSAPPCRKDKRPSATAEADRDSHIYEMVGVNALYNKSTDLNPESNAATVGTIRNRPPLPLPHEIPNITTLSRKNPPPLTSVPSTLSMDSGSSSPSNTVQRKRKELPPPPLQVSYKAPPRPPKQIEKESLPGSLRRQAKPTPAFDSPPAPALVKAELKQKSNGTESAMSELKNIFRKKNIGNDGATSPAATLERNPPKVQAKPFQKSNSSTKKPPNIVAKPNQPNQIKLILPKIESTLKTPKPVSAPKSVTPNASPMKKPQVEEKPLKFHPFASMKQPVPQPLATQKTPHIAIPPQKTQHMATPAPQISMKQQLKSPIQKRPLPKPDVPVLPEPVEDEPDQPLYQEADDEDFTPDADDDEEWTYEQLGQYNIYNI